MFRNAKSFVKKITLLTDPEPSFVSLVSGGANKSPFRSIKCEDDAMSILNTKKSDGLEFQSVIFKGETYKSAEDCKAWLSEGGISEDYYSLSEEATGFIALSKSDFQPETLEQIEFNGLSLIVGKMADSVTESVEAVAEITAASASKSDESVAPDAPIVASKFDAYDAVYSNATTISEVVTDASRWSGIPMGYYELNAVLTTALDHALRDGADTAVIRQIVSDYADRLVLLAEASKGIPSDERQALFDTFGNRVKAEDQTEIPAETETVEAVAPVEEEAVTQDSIAQTVEEQAVEQAAVAKSDLAEFRETMASIAETIAALNLSITSNSAKMETLSGRLERVENAGQTRKSATPDESVQVKRAETPVKVGGQGMAAFNGITN